MTWKNGRLRFLVLEKEKIEDEKMDDEKKQASGLCRLEVDINRYRAKNVFISGPFGVLAAVQKNCMFL